MDQKLPQQKYSVDAIKRAIADAIQLCTDAGLEPVVIGGMALDAWTCSRATMDLDLLVNYTVDDARRLITSIVRRGGTMDRPTTTERLDDVRQIKFHMGNLAVDVLQAWDPESKALIQRAAPRSCMGLDLMVPRLEDLIIQKLRVGRPRDIDDVTALITTNRKQLDRAWIEAKVRALHLTEEWEIVTSSVP